MNNELKHYGVKGMHWGVRRYQNYDGTLKNAKSRAKNAVNKRKAAYDYKHGAYKRSKTMTDEELRKANNRYAAEQQYRRNVQQDVKDSRGVAKSTLSRFGNQTTNVIIGGVASAVGAAAVAAILSKNRHIAANAYQIISGY